MSNKKYQHIKTYHNDIALKLAHKMFGLEHLHYGYFEKGSPVTLEGLNKAQHTYVEKLIEMIPKEVKIKSKDSGAKSLIFSYKTV